MTGPPFPDVEPTDGHREFAQQMRQTYVALQQEGFTQAEAMQIVATVIAAGIKGATGGSQ